MLNILVFIHIAFCCAAIWSGGAVLADLITVRFVGPHVVWYLRCSLGSNIAILLLRPYRVAAAQAVAMAAVYGAGLAFLAWRRFHLHGAWRNVFVVTLAAILYLNLLAFSIQVFGRDGLIAVVGPTTFLISQFLLLAAISSFGILAAKRFSDHSTRWQRWGPHK